MLRLRLRLRLGLKLGALSMQGVVHRNELIGEMTKWVVLGGKHRGRGGRETPRERWEGVGVRVRLRAYV